MKLNRLYIIITMLMAIVAANCGNSPQPPKLPQYDTEEEEDVSIKRNPAFSLYDSDGQGAYQLYRNKDRIASFSFDDGRKPIDMCSYNSDCFILISETPHNDTIADSLRANAEIYKNGRRIMEFNEKFKALRLSIDEGHFYVLGKMGDSEYTVFRDGLRTITFPAQQGSQPSDIHVFGQNIYIAIQRGATTDIYKDNNKLYSLGGICQDIKVSFRGVYVLMKDSLYLDKSVLMDNEYYRYSDKEMYAVPTMIATSDKDVIVGARASFDKQHSYASLFVNKQTYTTIQPDDKHIGASENSTVCCGVAISYETYYYVTAILTPEMQMMKPIKYYYHTDHNESFTLQFDNDQARLLMFTSN